MLLQGVFIVEVDLFCRETWQDNVLGGLVDIHLVCF